MYYFCLVLKVKQVISEIFILYFIVFKTDIRTFNTIYIYKFTKQRKIFIHPLSKKTKTKTNKQPINLRRNEVYFIVVSNSRICDVLELYTVLFGVLWVYLFIFLHISFEVLEKLTNISVDNLQRLLWHRQTVPIIRYYWCHIIHLCILAGFYFSNIFL